jgi:hypothetical protein
VGGGAAAAAFGPLSCASGRDDLRAAPCSSAYALKTLAQRPQRTWPFAFFSVSSVTRNVVSHPGQRVSNISAA